MATKKQKQELIDTLKFTPVQARILIQGYGGECYIGSVDRATYEFFKSKRIDVEQFANDWDGELFPDVPDEHRFCNPGSPYDCDDLFHQSGATMDDSSYITITNDDTNEDIFETNLSVGNLEDQGITVECSHDFESADLEPGSVIFWGGQGEKGCFFDGTFTLRAPFDPAKLRITYGNGDDWYLCSGVEYDGEEIEGFDGYSTTGKWGEHKFWIAGGEEVYEGEEREEIDVLENEETWASHAIDAESETNDEIDTEPELWEGIPLSPWHPVSLKPDIPGQYEYLAPNGGWPFPQRAEWTGKKWCDATGQKIDIGQWRGLAQPAG